MRIPSERVEIPNSQVLSICWKPVEYFQTPTTHERRNFATFIQQLDNLNK